MAPLSHGETGFVAFSVRNELNDRTVIDALNSQQTGESMVHLEQHNVNMFSWPPRSPDMSPMYQVYTVEKII